MRKHGYNARLRKALVERVIRETSFHLRYRSLRQEIYKESLSFMEAIL